MTAEINKVDKVKKQPILDKIAHGWGHLEGPILGWIAGSLPFIVRGTHGNAKTTVTKLLSLSMADKNSVDNGSRFVPCDKASIVTLAGIPSKKLMEEYGDLQFIPSRSTLIGPNVKGVTLDELTRATKETGNFLLEVVENKTLFGVPLHYKFLAATMNPETYKGAIKLDAALLDRFVGTLPIDDLSEIDSNHIESMIEINQTKINNSNYEREIADEIAARLNLVKTEYNKLIMNEDTLARVRSYVAQFGALVQPKLKSQNQPLLSGRELGNLFWRSIVSIAAYYVAVYGWSEAEALMKAADNTISYGLVMKHQLPSAIEGQIRAVHNDVKCILAATAKGAAGKLLLIFAKAQTGAQKVEFWRTHLSEVVSTIDSAEAFTMMENTISKIDEMEKNKKDKGNTNEILRTKAELYSVAKGEPHFQAIMDRIEGSMLCQLIDALREKDVSLERPPYNTVLGGDTIKASDILDLITAIQTGNMSNLVH